jgi:DNA sulfur modification protein DndD
MDITRQLSKLSDSLWSEDEKDRTVLYANNSRLLLTDFSKEMAKRKIHDLENEFIASFQRLSRKEDINLRAEINPETFTVKLIDRTGIEIDKDDLSAGEKQIYAIAILEALARTSGRKLPIIIDTPLARLDSIHRTNLIQNYFPYASHQVIILSTDTEVDEEFYDKLSKHISHAYKLNYSSTDKSTTAKEGYFWRSKQMEVT